MPNGNARGSQPPRVTPQQYRASIAYQKALQAYRDHRYDTALGQGRN